jgi:flagellar hook assembly protein FlgD
VLNTEIVDNPFSIDAFPNPVYTSQNEKVNFQLSNQTRLNQNKGELSVFNIKGQLVHRQEIDFNRDNSLQWNCRLESGTKAASGVYLYRINTGKNSSVGKFIITK